MKDGKFGLPSFTKKIGSFPRKTLLISVAAILGIAILVLAGFGFYHIFIFDGSPIPTVEKQTAADSQNHPSPATGKMMSINDTQKPSSGTEDTPKPPAREVSKPEGKTTGKPSPKVKPSPSPKTAAPKPAEAAAQNPTKLLKASICSNIENKNPAGVNTIFPFSIGRIYIWTQIHAEKVPTQIHHIYYLKDERIIDVVLEVRSAFWRTWSYKTLDKDWYRGNWHVDITTSDGTVLRRLYFRVE